MRAEANLHMVPARFDLDQPAAKHRCRHTCRQTHTHALCGVHWKNVTEEATLQACSGLDSLLHSDRKHHSYICILSLSYVPSLIYPAAVIFLLLPVCLVTQFIQNCFGTENQWMLSPATFNSVTTFFLLVGCQDGSVLLAPCPRNVMDTECITVPT